METITTNNANKRNIHPLFKWILVAGIAIVANLFLNFSIDAFYPSPEYEKFCPVKQVMEVTLSKDACLAKGGQWSENLYPKDVYRAQPVVTAPMEVVGYCNENYTCGMNFETANKAYQRNVFIALVVAGTIFLVGSIFVAFAEAVALGFSIAGILSLIIGTMRYWPNMDDRLRVVVLGFALASLIWVGIKKFKN